MEEKHFLIISTNLTRSYENSLALFCSYSWVFLCISHISGNVELMLRLKLNRPFNQK